MKDHTSVFRWLKENSDDEFIGEIPPGFNNGLPPREILSNPDKSYELLDSLKSQFDEAECYDVKSYWRVDGSRVIITWNVYGAFIGACFDSVALS